MSETKLEEPRCSQLDSIAWLGRLERVVAELADPLEWNWTRMMSHRDAADCALSVLAREGLIQKRRHPLGGLVWRVGDALYGRTDGITSENYHELKAP